MVSSNVAESGFKARRTSQLLRVIEFAVVEQSKVAVLPAVAEHDRATVAELLGGGVESLQCAARGVWRHFGEDHFAIRRVGQMRNGHLAFGCERDAPLVEGLGMAMVRAKDFTGIFQR